MPVPETAGLRHDSTAFVEALRLPTTLALKQRRQREAARARQELAHLMAEVNELATELGAAKRALDARDYSRLSVTRRLRSGRRPVTLEHEVEGVQLRLARKHEEVKAKHTETETLERDARELSEAGDGVTVYRLHSARHSVNCSRGQYEHLSGVQRTTPVRLAAKNGLRWWWYRDRFWWADAKRSPHEVESTILMLDLASLYQREAFERVRAEILGSNGLAPAEDAVPEHVGREVWIRDRGCCVDCGAASSLAFDHLLPLAAGGTNTPPNLELRCRACLLRRRTNEARATVGKARIGAHAAKEWGVYPTNVGWPRAS
jgi:hypothetical protein